jgi:hypothetical protein
MENRRGLYRRIAATATALAVLVVPWAAAAAEPTTAEPGAGRSRATDAPDRVRIAYTPRVFHFTSNDDYVDWNHIVALEYITPRHVFWGADRSHFGLSVFDNSYGQFSQSLYFGLEWNWQTALGGQLFFSVSPGLVHGYKEPYENRVPLNQALGVGVTIVPAIGWERERLGLAVSLVGSAVGIRGSWKFGARTP